MIVTTALHIRRPVGEVFRAFTDPDVTTKFWFTKSSGPLRPGATVRWEWEMYGVGTDVTVKDLVENERILVEWDADAPTSVEWKFREENGVTRVEVTHDTRDDVAATAIDSMQGFSWLLAGAKAWLEHGIRLALVEDKG
jgi:uncharacterized protein YndB with AHSA1/START domain